MNGDFCPPDIDLFDVVMVSGHPDHRKAAPGLVLNVKSGGICDIMMMTMSNFIRFEDCHHKNDPWVTAHRELILEDRERGVWDLADCEKAKRMFVQRLQALEAARVNLEQRVAGLELATQTAQQLVERMDGLQATLEEHGRQLAGLRKPKGKAES